MDLKKCLKKCQFSDFFNLLILQPRKAFSRSRMSQKTFCWPKLAIQNEKTPFQVLKKRSSKNRKSDIFPKGLTDGFRPKMAIFLTFFFQATQARKISFITFQNEKLAFQAIKTRRSKCRKIDIFPRGLTHGFSPKIGRFLELFCLANLGQENVLCDILERKNAFLSYKSKQFKKSKN